MKEPRWARRLRFWLWDDSPLWLPEAITRVVLRTMCLLWGHGAIDDQCDRPEHRHCWRCLKPMPFAETVV